MKTVNFLEALEINKTRPVTQCFIEPSRRIDTKITFEVGELRKNLSSGAHYLSVGEYQGGWEFEPEKIEVLCKWESREFPKANGSQSYDLVYPTNTDLDIFAKLVGKNTKLTIEVLDV